MRPGWRAASGADTRGNRSPGAAILFICYYYVLLLILNVSFFIILALFYVYLLYLGTSVPSVEWWSSHLTYFHRESLPALLTGRVAVWCGLPAAGRGFDARCGACVYWDFNTYLIYSKLWLHICWGRQILWYFLCDFCMANEWMRLKWHVKYKIIPYTRTCILCL